jgi:hypothetical protein
MIVFEEYFGDLKRLPTSENHINFRWLNDDCIILFSVCQQGEAASCHFSSDRKGLRRLREAINQFVEFVFWLFDWCEMIIAKVLKRSVCKLLEDCCFSFVAKFGNVSIYERKR